MDEPERIELISRMFALITAKFEDGAGLAGESQGKRPAAELIEHARELSELATEISTIVDATGLILDQ